MRPIPQRIAAGMMWRRSTLQGSHGCAPQKLVLLGFRRVFMPLLSLVDIRDADHRGPSALPRGDHTEFGDLRFREPECLLMVPVGPALGWSVGAPCCNASPTPCEFPASVSHSRESRNPWHSRRMLPTTRSQKAFAWGTRNGVLRMLKPIASTAESNAEE